MSGNRAFKQIANNLSGSDYIKNKKSKAIYKTYRGSPDKINKNVIIEENSLASAESYEMLNLITNGKDITYTMSGGEGTAAISLQNLYSSSDTWKGSLLKSEDGKVDLAGRSGLVSANLFVHITAGNTDTNATDGVYHNVPLSGGSGSGAVVTVTVSSSVVSAIAVTAAGSGYAAGDVLTISAGFAGAGSTARTITLQANDLTQSINEPLFLQSIYGTNGTVGCVTEETSQLSFTCCGTAGTASYPQSVPKPSLTGNSFSPMSIHPGSSDFNDYSLGEVYNDASYYVYTVDQDFGISVSTNDNNVLVALSSQVAIGSKFTVTVTPFNKCRESGTNTSKSFEVTAIPPIPTPTSLEIDSPIYVTPGGTAYSTVKLSDVFKYATNYKYQQNNTEGNNITISTGPDTRIKVEWPSGPVLGENVTISVYVTAENASGTGATTKYFTVKPALPSVTSTNANKTEVTSTTDNKNYVLYTFDYSALPFDNSAMPVMQGTLSVDFTGTTNNTLNSNVLLVAGGAAGGLMTTGLYSGGSVKNGSGGGGAGGYASGQMPITKSSSSTTTYSISVGNGGKGLIDGSYSTSGNGVQGRDTSISLNGVSVIKVFGGGSGLYTHTPGGVGSGGSTGGNSHAVQLKPVETSLSTITGYGNLGGELEFGNMGEPAPERGGGGGGGAGGAGTSGINEPGTDTATRGGNGGIGKEWEINNTIYGGGGGGSGAEDNIIRVGQGGSGGGGTTNTIGNDTGDYNGTNGLGGGGAGGWHNSLYRGDGGSGVCIIAFEKGTISY